MPISHRKLVPHSNNKWQASSLYQKYMHGGTTTLGNSTASVRDIIEEAVEGQNHQFGGKIPSMRAQVPSTSIIITKN